ncbi:MAG: efflux RND transporter permease subunit [Deltaproteobacteria bacterium]|nr:efflux RND transporter permease subunit [Deltaproteobacteria bacterium]
MRLSDVSIERPVFATVMSLLILVAGAAAFFSLPIRELPDVDSPVISITTLYVGASPETVEASVTEPLEEVLNGIEGIRNIDSLSAFGVSSINVHFTADKDVDIAATDVSNAIQRGLGDLPQEAERPIVRKSGANMMPIMFLNVLGEKQSAVDRTDVADRLVQTPMQLLPGVSQAILSGERRYAMRIWLDPARMAALRVDPSDVRRALQESNLQLPAGEVEAATRKFIINADARLVEPRDFEAIVIREEGGNPVRIRDVGWVELGSENYQMVTRHTARDTVGVGIVRHSKANELEVSAAVRAKIEEIRPTLPEGFVTEVAADWTTYVRDSLREVSFTLFISFCVVVLVNLIFLQSKTATFVASVAIPISLIGTFAGMAVLGFSLNMLTLLGLVLAIGLVVDDAIVVLENVYRRQELGEPMLLAARNGAREVGFPVLATTAALVAVMVSLAFMSGDTGRLFREFALAVAVAIVISAFVALSIVPMVCSRWLRVKHRSDAVSTAINSRIDAVRDAYDRVLGFALAHRHGVAIAFVLLIAGTGVLFRLLPQTFLPVEDRGRFITMIRAPEGSTVAYTRSVLDKVEQALLAVPEVDTFFAAIGIGFGTPSSSATGMVFTSMDEWDERERSQQEVVAELFPKFMSIPEALVFVFSPSSLQRQSNADVEIAITSSAASLEEFAQVMGGIVGRARQVPGLINVDSDLRLANPQLDIAFDRDRAADLGVPIASVSQALALLVSQGKADDFILRNEQYDVVMALESPFRSVPEQLGQIHVRTREGEMVPLSAMIETKPHIGPTFLNHYDLQRSATVSANLAPGAALGPALSAVQQIVREELPQGFAMKLRGTSREFAESGAAVYATFALALLVIYLVLAAQLESFLHPFTVLLSVPLATLGALLSLFATGNTINLYSQIGIILLVGLVTKNAILLVDFANQERARGAELIEALRRAGHTRFRPIVMTSATSILGAVPLVVPLGPGHESRAAIGTAVIGGLLFSTLFTLVMIPVFHFGVVTIAEKLGLKTIPPKVEFDAEPVVVPGA